MTRWVILTGEYPPQAGGVADYTRLVARGLAEAGDEVTVFAPGANTVGNVCATGKVTVRRLPDHFGPRGLMVLDRELARQVRPDRILIQYVPHAFGYKALNLPFVWWAAVRGRRIAPVWVMFHEVMYPIEPGQRWRHAFLGRVNWLMARWLGRSADRVFVSIPAWGELLRQIGVVGRAAEWLPVPSNVPADADTERVKEIRGRVGGKPGVVVIGHFGTFGPLIAERLGPSLAELLRRAESRVGLLLGRNSTSFAEWLAVEHPDLAGRLTAAGELPAEDVAAHLAACDLLLQPYPDGASCRRSSLMTGLALGITTVTNRGRLSEPVWGGESPGVAVAPSPKADDLVAAAEKVLVLPCAERRERGRIAAAWYESHFALRHTIDRLQPPSRSPWVIVSSGFHFAAGQAKAVASLADYLVRGGTPVHLVGHEFDARFLDRPGVTIHRVPGIERAQVVGNQLVARAGRKVAWRVKREHPRARVVVNGGNCYWADVNWVHYLHAAWKPDLSTAPRWFRLKERLVGRLYRRQERQAIQAARLVLTNSKRTTADVIAHLGIPAERVRTIYYGADPSWAPPSEEERRQARERFGLPANRPVVVFVGGFGLDNRKGFDTLLEAWRHLCRSPDWDAELVLAGGGKASADVARRLAREGLSNRARMIGFTQEVFDLLAAADLLVSPVRYEPYGLNVQEAICRGVPALVSAVAGVAEEYSPELADMLLPNPEDADDLAARLRTWRSDMPGWKVRFAPLSARLRARTWDEMSREILSTVLNLGE